ncbi:hypothetical protein [Uliginosibacterium aquaticum]|uniref:Uncharacterized protein n=1 Tax=Uliginosibacterium aquaticum TaxID=2731212 RepID=A0ABX2IB00_9RHOO|nr:hypothetical protein [Uliginosibacterium aquaticum]NSL53534.1 hypothetical protein [Uliginosibacterium aquaticum]
MHRSIKPAAGALLLSLILVACGGGGGDDSGSSTTTPAASSAAASSKAASSAATATSSTAAATSSTAAAVTLFQASDLDADSWFWFSNGNAINYLVGESDSCVAGSACSLDASKAANSGEFIFGYSSTLATPSSTSWNSGLTLTSTGVTYTKTGALVVPKASSAGGADGGSAVFKLSKLSSFSAFIATTGSLYYAVDVSADGSAWTEKYTAGTTAIRSKGESTEDIGAKAGTSASTVYVRIRNLGTGGLNIMGVKIVQ